MRPKRIGGCRLTATAGSGGFAVTYLAEHPSHGPVAVKVLSPNWANNINVLHRFEAEAETLERALTELDEQEIQAIPRYVDHGVDDGQPYLVTEFCGGGSLAQRLEVPVNDRIGAASWITDQALARLVIVHDRLGVIHRDLSPANLLFRPLADGTEQLVVADFGLMKEAAQASNFSRILGTARYAAPEVRDEGLCDARSDVYSLGVIAWELITGGQASERERLTSLTSDPSVPTELAAAIDWMTEPQRDHRPLVEQVQPAFQPRPGTQPTGPPPAPLSITEPLVENQIKPRVKFLALGAAGIALVGIVAGLAFLNGSDDPITTATVDETAANTTTTTPISTTSVTVTEPELTPRAPEDAGFAVDLEADWEPVDVAPESGILLGAQSEERSLVLVVGTIQAGLITTALQLGVESLGADAEIVSTDNPSESFGRLQYREDGNETVMFFRNEGCGTLVMSVSSAAGLMEEETLAYVDGLGDRFRLVGDVAVPRADADGPEGFESFEYKGLKIDLPSSYFISESLNHCFLAIDDNDENSRQFNVTFFPGGSADDMAALSATTWADDGAEIISTQAAGWGVPRLHISDAAAGSESVWYFVQSDGGVYALQALELRKLPLSDDDLAVFDTIAATFEASG